MSHYIEPILGQREVAPGIVQLTFAIPQGLTWQEGAHLHLAFPDALTDHERDPSGIRHMSIATLPQEGHVALLTRLRPESPFKRRLAAQTLGDPMRLYDISSRMILQRSQRPLHFWSMGVGLATVRSLLMAWRADPCGIPCLHSHHVGADCAALFAEEFTARPVEMLTHSPCTSRRALFSQLEALQEPDALHYLVGSDAFLKDLSGALLARGVPEEHLFIDKKPHVRTLFFKTRHLIRPLTRSLL
ncbi:hypothetical protein ABB02_01789 [Clostridiaceae bacterium JG1575]|nr:hypothetical protein ABB02_01789 [Clostridiaceae bacterium JG1575]